MKISGFFSSKKPDRISRDDVLDNTAQKRLHRFQERLAKIVISSNHELIGKALPVIKADSFARLSVKTTNARVQYLSQIMKITELDGNASEEDIAELARRRLAYEELTQAFEALERLIERGYAQFID